ncbi:MAG: SRPBCC domain-containing protein, partial [Acidimicrobiales bacterium]
MTDLTIERAILIEAPADIVWRTITEPDQIAHWFADRVQLDLTPGGNGTLVFEDMVNIAPLVVETVDPPHRFTFRWGHPDSEAPVPGNSVVVEFTLSAESNERTRLRVVETGLDAISWPDEEKARYADDHRNGWATHLGHLGELFAP